VAAYMIFQNRLTDADAMQDYIPKAVETLMAYGAEVIVMDENTKVLEGTGVPPRTIIAKFESRERAEAWYSCAEYQAVRPIRMGATEGWGLLVDGFEMPS
jgi:uncharacterized protein (DUF1330 family)